MITQADLIVDKAPNRTNGKTDAHGPVELAAHRLAVQFTEDELLPTRYRRTADSAQRKRRPKEDSEVEKRFSAKVQVWRNLIETMLEKLPPGQAWRFINLAPKVEGDINKMTDKSDFCNFIDYLILRCDKEKCDNDELGGLAQLSTAFQREVKMTISKQESGKTESGRR